MIPKFLSGLNVSLRTNQIRFSTRTLLLTLLLGCTTTVKPNPAVTVNETTFSHNDLDTVLQQFVDMDGRVDYRGLLAHRSDLDRYIAQVARISPDSHPELFPTEQDQLAYWINAYNAATINLVLEHYPITGVSDVSPPWYAFFLPSRSGFFYFNRTMFGEKAISLYTLENSIIRKRYEEPRIHFALNCASRGCPRLPRHAFTAESLNKELDREARFFFSEPRNFLIDHEHQQILLSEILKWYEDDFTEGISDRGLGETIVDYARLHLPSEVAEELDRAKHYEVVYKPYDWSLNDQELRPPANAVR